MKKIAFITAFILSPIFLSGCQTTSGGESLASKGQILKAMGQGLLGSSLDEFKKADRQKVLEAEYRALEYTNAGNSVTWVSSDEQSKGTVTPGQPYKVGAQNCRQYNHSFIVKGVPQTMRGSACRNDDGSWTPLS